MRAHGEKFSQAVELSLYTVTTKSGKNGRSRENTSRILKKSVSKGRSELRGEGVRFGRLSF